MNLIQDKLTNREQEIYKYLLRGMSYGDISKELNIAHRTVVAHIMSVYMKKLVGTRSELMAQRIQELEDEVEELRKVANG